MNHPLSILASTEFLGGTALVVLVFVAMVFWSRRWRRRYAAENFATTAKNYRVSYAKRGIRYLFLLAAIGFLGTSISPLFDGILPNATIRGEFFIIALDASSSMDVVDSPDTGVSRLAFAKRIASTFIMEHPDNTYAVVAFADSAATLSPPSTDASSTLHILGSISSKSIGEGGTNLNAAMSEIERLGGNVTDTLHARPVTLLFSDGGERENMPSVDYYGAPIIAIWVGSEAGGHIPAGNDLFGNTVFRKWRGETVLSTLFPESLKRIANTSDGTYLLGNENMSQNLERSLRSLISKNMSGGGKSVSVLLFLICFGWYLCIPDRFSVWDRKQ